MPHGRQTMNTSEDNGTKRHDFIMNVPGFRDEAIVYYEKYKSGKEELTVYCGFDCKMLEIFHTLNKREKVQHWNLRVDLEGNLKTVDPRKAFIKDIIEECEDQNNSIMFTRLEINDLDKWITIWKTYL